MKHRTRLERAEQLGVAAIPLAQGPPRRQVATNLGFARLTRRDWCAAGAVAGLPVTVIQGARDETKALRRHLAQDLGVPHATDLFHDQHEVSKASSRLLARQVK